MGQKKRRQNQRQRTRRQQKKNARSRKQRSRPTARRAAASAPAARATKPDATAGADLQRWSRLLTKAEKDPEIVLEDPRCLKPHFVARFFDLCDGKALEAPSAAPDYAEAALKLAEKLDDRHQLNIARGIAVHACIANKSWSMAAEGLSEYQRDAFDCCTACASDWLRRQGDLLVETHDPELSRGYLELAAKVLGDDLDDDSRGRILFVRGIAYFYLGDREQALDDVGEALRLLSLQTAAPYFMDALAMVGCFLQGGAERRHYQVAQAHLKAFRERLKGVTGKSWLEVRDRLRWVLAQVEAWIGHPRRARACLERLRAKHIKHSPHRYALAIGVDEALVYCMHLPDVHIRSIRGILAACKRQLKLEPEIKRSLRQACRDLGQWPWRVREILVALRRSYIVPVPGLLTERVVEAAAAER